jgi:hypothetical protein
VAYGTQTAARNAIAAGTIAAFPSEIKALEIALLGYGIIQGNGTGGSGTNGAVAPVTSLQIFGAQFASGGAVTAASLITTTIANFDGILGAGNTNVQSCLETIDDFGKTGGFKVPSATTVQRDALTPAVGMMIVNTTTSRVQCYVNGTWTDLN